jgi:uncharacterized protein YprB with RNaseH-like and TPR domain
MPTLADKFSRLSALKPSRAATRFEPATRRAPEEEDALSRLVGAGIATNRFGDHVSVSNWYSSPEFFEASANTLDLLCRSRDVSQSKRALTALSDPTKWLFLDTETTGLSGGTGTYAFLIGLAWWDSGGLQVEQLFMRDFHEEHSILHELSARLAERPVLVTFNGKSFDWPLLENRFTMTRSISTPKIAAHLDLLHPSRALWKLRLGSVRLVELERHVLDAPRLGWHRDEDVLSSQIPQHYFNYLRGGPAQPLAAVIRHNQMDLRGLAAILSRIDALLETVNRSEPYAECGAHKAPLLTNTASPTKPRPSTYDPSSTDNPSSTNAPPALHADSVAPPRGVPPDVESLDLFSVSRFLHKRGDRDRAHAACSHALTLGLPAEHRPKARRELALHAKRRGDFEQAAALWHDLAAQSSFSSDLPDSIHACEQLAAHYERRAKNFERALEFARLALTKLARLRTTSRDPYASARLSKIEQKLLNRITRLQHRINFPARAARDLPLLQPRERAQPASRDLCRGAGLLRPISASSITKTDP